VVGATGFELATSCSQAELRSLEMGLNTGSTRVLYRELSTTKRVLYQLPKDRKSAKFGADSRFLQYRAGTTTRWRLVADSSQEIQHLLVPHPGDLWQEAIIAAQLLKLGPSEVENCCDAFKYFVQSNRWETIQNGMKPAQGLMRRLFYLGKDRAKI